MASMAKLSLAPPAERGRRGSRPFTFNSICTACGHERVQNFYTRRDLLSLIEKAQAIDAYCGACDVVWPLNARERDVMSRAITAEQTTLSMMPVLESGCRSQA